MSTIISAASRWFSCMIADIMLDYRWHFWMCTCVASVRLCCVVFISAGLNHFNGHETIKCVRKSVTSCWSAVCPLRWKHNEKCWSDGLRAWTLSPTWNFEFAWPLELCLRGTPAQALVELPGVVPSRRLNGGTQTPFFFSADLDSVVTLGVKHLQGYIHILWGFCRLAPREHV